MYVVVFHAGKSLPRRILIKVCLREDIGKCKMLLTEMHSLMVIAYEECHLSCHSNMLCAAN